MEELPESHDAPAPLDSAPPEGWTELTPALPPVGILAGLTDTSLANIAAFGQYRHFPAGTEIIREGDAQDRFYVVVTGKLAITALASGKEVSLSEAGPGECLGEVSLLEPGPASASVRVVKEATLWSMNIENFRVYLAKHPGGAGALLLGMASCLSQRLRQANQLINQHHVKPVETLPEGRERAITAENTPVEIGFFDWLKKPFAGQQKSRISTDIKM
jgi:CRP-like cAMP-binding protein